MKDLASAFTAANAAVFAKLGLDPKHADVRRSDRPDLGEFQANGALAVAKAAGKKPQEKKTRNKFTPKQAQIRPKYSGRQAPRLGSSITRPPSLCVMIALLFEG